MSHNAFKKIEAGLNDAIAIARGEIEPVRQRIISDAYLKFALRMVRQQRRIEELKRFCGVK